MAGEADCQQERVRIEADPELSFGFWRFLLSKRYQNTLWAPHLRKAFPGMRTQSREVVYKHNLILPKHKKLNPLIGNGGVSAVPDSARISQIGRAHV